MKRFSFIYPFFPGVVLLFGVILIQDVALAKQELTLKPPILSPKDLKRPIPMDQLIVQTRKGHGEIIVQYALLTTLDQRQVYVFDFTDLGGEGQRIVYDAITGKELIQVPLKEFMPLDQVVAKTLERHKNATAKSSHRSIQDGNQVVIINLEEKNKKWEVTVDAYTGMLITEYMYELKPTGKQLSLVHIIEKAREQHKGLVVLRTRQTVFKNIPARELIARDQHNVRRKMIFNAQSGELLSNKPVTGYQY